MPTPNKSRVVAAVASEPTVTLGWAEDLGDGWDNLPTWYDNWPDTIGPWEEQWEEEG